MRLGLLDPPTCVGLRYGRCASTLRGFSWPPCRSLLALRHASAALLGRGVFLPASSPCSLRTSLQLEADLYGGVTPSLHTPVLECSPVVHRLRFSASAKARLTRRGLTFRRKPQVYGACGSHARFATHASILAPVPSTPGFPDASPETGRSPTDGLASIPWLRWQA